MDINLGRRLNSKLGENQDRKLVRKEWSEIENRAENQAVNQKANWTKIIWLKKKKKKKIEQKNQEN